MKRGRLLAYAGAALVLGAAFAIILLAPRPDPPAKDEARETPTLPPTPERTVVYDDMLTSAASPDGVDGRHVFAVREGDHDLAIVIEWVSSPTDPAFSIALEDPSGAEIERCRGGTCEWNFSQPDAGLWRFIVPAQGAQPVATMVSIVRVAEVPQEEAAYVEERNFPPTTASSSWKDAFVVEKGQDELEFTLGVAGPATAIGCTAATQMTFFTPDGQQAGGVTPGSAFTLKDAKPGRYLLEYRAGPCSQVLGTVTARRT